MKTGKRLLLVVVCALAMVSSLLFFACTDSNECQDIEYGEWQLTAAPDCDTLGVETRVSKTDPTVFETRAVAATGHEWGEYVVETEPTCLTAGVMTRVCLHNASHIDKTPIAPLGHAFDNWETLVDATCLSSGTERSVCSHDSSHVETRTIQALGHDYGDWVLEVAPTCTTPAIETRICKNDCNHTELRNAPALGHNMNEWCVTVIPTCTHDGEETRICKNDNTHVETRVIDAIGHDFGEWITTVVPTEMDDGEQIRVCKNDKNHIETREIFATGTIDALYFELKGDAYHVGLYNHSAESVVIPSFYQGLPVTNISTYGFAFSPALKSVAFSENSQLKVISEGAFASCEKLSQIDLPSSLEYIGIYAFGLCESLNDIIIPENVGFVGESALGERYYYEEPLFIHVRGSHQETLSWDTDWFVPAGVLVVYDSTYQYGESQPQFFTVDYIAGEGGICLQDTLYKHHPNVKQFVFGGQDCMTVEAKAYLGYEFVGWSDGKTTAERTDTNIGSNLTITANFKVDFDGEGTVSSPYLVNDYDDLLKVAAFPDAHFLLTADIDLAFKNFVPLFYSSSRPFNGVFDGGGKTISNFKVQAPSEVLIRPYYQFPSLFGVISQYGAVKNLNVMDFDITVVDFDTSGYSLDISPISAGGLAGISIGRLENISVRGKITASGLSHDGIAIGGVAGQMMSGGAENCVADVEIILDDFIFTGLRRYAFNIGGLFGIANTDLINCSANAKIRVENMTDPNDDGVIVVGSYSGVSVGGLVGMYYTIKDYLPETVTIRDCNASVDILVDCKSNVGGLIAFISSSSVFSIKDSFTSGTIHRGGAASGFINTLNIGEGSTVENCSSTVDILSASSGSGFVGVTQSNGSGIELVDGDGNRIGNGPITIKNCHVVANVTASSAHGFFYGLSYASVIDCYFSGDVTSATGNAFGFSGQMRESTVEGCYVLGNVSANVRGSGFASLILQSEVTRCYFDGTVSGVYGAVGFVYTANRATVKECYAVGTVSCVDTVGLSISIVVSGFIGVAQGVINTIEDCYSLCDIIFEGVEDTRANIGGFVGLIMLSSSSKITMKNCYYAGKITVDSLGTSWVGGFISQVSSQIITLEDCYWIYFEDGDATESIGRHSYDAETMPKIEKRDSVS